MDLSYYNGSKAQFDAEYGGVVPPTGGSMYTNGVDIKGFEEFGYMFQSIFVPQAAIKVAGFVYGEGAASWYAENLLDGNPKIFFNFSPFDFNTMKVTQALKIGGHEYSNLFNPDGSRRWGPWLEWIDNKPNINHIKTDWKNTVTAAQSWRYIFENGAINAQANDDWNQQYSQGLVAYDTQNNTIILSSTGDRYGAEGPTLYQMADLLGRWVSGGYGEYPIVNAIQRDSGHSVQTAWTDDTGDHHFSGPEDANRNAAVCYGYIRLNDPLIRGTAPEPTPPPTAQLEPITLQISVPETENYQAANGEIVIAPK